MSRIIQMRRGLESSIPQLKDGEIGVSTDLKHLFYGAGGINNQAANQAEMSVALGNKVNKATGWQNISLWNSASGIAQYCTLDLGNGRTLVFIRLSVSGMPNAGSFAGGYDPELRPSGGTIMIGWGPGPILHTLMIGADGGFTLQGNLGTAWNGPTDQLNVTGFYDIATP